MLLRSVVVALVVTTHGLPHDGPDPIGSWRLAAAHVKDGTLQSLLGVAGRIEGKVAFDGEQQDGAMYFDGEATCIVLADDYAKSEQQLPTRHMTVTAWASISTGAEWGGLLGVVQDNGDAEAGWVLGYNEQCFTFG